MKEYAAASEASLPALINLVNQAMVSGWECAGGIVVMTDKDAEGRNVLVQALQRERRGEMVPVRTEGPRPKKILDEAGTEIGTATLPADGKELQIGGKRYAIVAVGDGDIATVRELVDAPPPPPSAAPAANDAAPAAPAAEVKPETPADPGAAAA